MERNSAGPDDILSTYEAVSGHWAAERSQDLFERPWLSRLLDEAPGRDVLDIGCGDGQPLATWLVEQGANLTGTDGSSAMCDAFRAALPGVPCYHADMRRLDLGQRFHALLAWNSFFHLSPDAQRGMFAVFAAHAASGAILMFTSGPAEGVQIGHAAGEPIYHASLDPVEYRALLAGSGFTVRAFVPEDPDCRGHTIWMARYEDSTLDPNEPVASAWPVSKLT